MENYIKISNLKTLFMRFHDEGSNGSSIFFLSSIFFRLSNKNSFAAFRAEIVGFTLVFIYCSKFFIQFYPTYRIDRHTSKRTF